jgi:hypothetical protein
MPPDDSDMAGQLFNDTYLFAFLGTVDVHREATVEQALVAQVQKFLHREATNSHQASELLNWPKANA